MPVAPVFAGPAASKGLGMSRRLGVLLLVTTWFCWGFSYPATRIMLESFDVWTSRLVIMIAAAVLLLGQARLAGASLRVPRDEWRDLVISALLNMAAFQIAMTFGVWYLSSGRTAVIAYTMPLWAALFAWPILGERLTMPRAAALSLGLAGLGVMMSQSLPNLRDAPLGAASALIAAVAFGLGTVWLKRRRWQTHATVLAGWQLVVGMVPVLALWTVFGEAPDLASITDSSWLALAYQVAIANALAYFAWFRVVATFPATVSGIGAMAVPIVGVFASAVLVDEAIGWRELTALSLVCAGIAINLMAARRA
jgi:drug/metabolite transporter (DMT)-like permease